MSQIPCEEHDGDKMEVESGVEDAVEDRQMIQKSSNSDGPPRSRPSKVESRPSKVERQADPPHRRAPPFYPPLYT